MNKNIILLVIAIIILLPFILSCENSQININTASKSELDKIINVGPATADRIITSRPFGSLEDLIDVKYIGEITLNEIKDEGLACAEKGDSQENNTSQSSDETNSTNSPENKQKIESSKENEETKKINNSPIKIELNQNSLEEEINSKDIKKPTNKDINKDKIAKYGLIGFSFFLITIYFVKHKKRYKNEFR